MFLRVRAIYPLTLLDADNPQQDACGDCFSKLSGFRGTYAGEYPVRTKPPLLTSNRSPEEVPPCGYSAGSSGSGASHASITTRDPD